MFLCPFVAMLWAWRDDHVVALCACGCSLPSYWVWREWSLYLLCSYCLHCLCVSRYRKHACTRRISELSLPIFPCIPRKYGHSSWVYSFVQWCTQCTVCITVFQCCICLSVIISRSCHFFLINSSQYNIAYSIKLIIILWLYTCNIISGPIDDPLDNLLAICTGVRNLTEVQSHPVDESAILCQWFPRVSYKWFAIAGVSSYV